MYVPPDDRDEMGGEMQLGYINKDGALRNGHKIIKEVQNFPPPPHTMDDFSYNRY